MQTFNPSQVTRFSE